MYLRYIDDIFLHWNGSLESLQEFVSHLNGTNPNIKLTLQFSNVEINFLDMKVAIKDGKFMTKLYTKETDTQRLLHKTSFHPPHTFKGVVKSQIMRFARICDDGQAFSDAFKALKSQLLQVGYSRAFLRRCKKTVLEYMNWQPSRISYLLPKGFHPCGNSRCACCQHAKRAQSGCGLRPASNFLIPQLLSCDSKSVVYGIYCSYCKPEAIFYVGMTRRTLRERVTQHRSTITRKVPTSVSTHFLTSGHSLTNLRVMAIEQIKKSDQLEHRENHWIKKLGTDTLGANVRDEMRHLRPLPFVIPFHPATVWLAHKIRDNLDSLGDGKPCSTVVPAFKRFKNLQELVAPNKFK